jgi:hypothetical protein
MRILLMCIRDGRGKKVGEAFFVQKPRNTTGHKKRIEMPVCGYQKIFLKDPAALPKRREQIKKLVEGYPVIPMKSIASLRALSVFPLTDIFAPFSTTCIYMGGKENK